MTLSPYRSVPPTNRAQRRARRQEVIRTERAQRRSRARIQRALSTYKESAS